LIYQQPCLIKADMEPSQCLKNKLKWGLKVWKTAYKLSNEKSDLVFQKGINGKV
jgi:hypothetical protein